MERVAGSVETTSCESGYVGWEEVFVPNEKGRREVHYLLKRSGGGGSDLAVVGKEKSSRHMSYRYAMKNVSFGPLFKLRSRRDVTDWLDSVVSDSSAGNAVLVAKQGFEPGVGALKDSKLQKEKSIDCAKEFSWVGSSWICKKKRKHYPSFKRNGFLISVNEFVFVLAEENKRLVAYLEDLYEDSRGNKMVTVRWFHKIDEVGIALPHSSSAREVFFSLYLQDLSIECIDGSAFILSPQHYEKFQNVAHRTNMEPFVCSHQFDNDEVRPFNITQIKGYWKQKVIRYLYSQLDSESNMSSGQFDDCPEQEENHQCAAAIRPKKRQRLTKDDGKDAVDFAVPKLENPNYCKINNKTSTENNSMKLSVNTKIPAIRVRNEHASQYLVVGCHVEVLSQDSGIRGCWFRASIIKKHKDKVKVQYQDIQDAVEEDKKLEEWVSASRIAVADDLGLRLCDRKKIRPAPQPNKSDSSWAGDVGFIVDAWWHDGWWEGIIVKKETEASYHVYFPGEKVVSVFGPGNLRHSQDWAGNGWVNLRERPDLVTSILSCLKAKQNSSKSHDSKPTVASSGDGVQSKQANTCLDPEKDRPRKPEMVPDLLKDDSLFQLRWKITGKRKRSSSATSYQKPRCVHSHRKKSSNILKSDAPDNFVIPASLKVDHDDCKYAGDPSIFSSSVVPSLTTNLVMCR